MHAFVVLNLTCLVVVSAANGSGHVDVLRKFATLLLSQQPSPYRTRVGHRKDRMYFNHLSRSVAARLDADRCYYGELDAEGNVLSRPKPRLERGSPLMPSPTNTPIEVVDAQFRAFSRDYDSRSIGDAFAHVSPKIIAQHGLDADKFKNILKGPRMDGIIGCDSWEVLGMESPSSEHVAVSLKVLPKPIPGCVKTSGVAGQGGITWPTFWKWDLGKVTEGPHAGCWMLEQMTPQAPPSVTTVDISTQDASGSGSVLSVNAQKRVQTRPNDHVRA